MAMRLKKAAQKIALGQKIASKPAGNPSLLSYRNLTQSYSCGFQGMAEFPMSLRRAQMVLNGVIEIHAKGFLSIVRVSSLPMPVFFFLPPHSLLSHRSPNMY